MKIGDLAMLTWDSDQNDIGLIIQINESIWDGSGSIVTLLSLRDNCLMFRSKRHLVVL